MTLNILMIMMILELMMMKASDTNSCDGKIKQVTQMFSQEDHDSDDDIATDGDQGKRYQKL